jgi:hypothetical protein
VGNGLLSFSGHDEQLAAAGEWQSASSASEPCDVTIEICYLLRRELLEYASQQTLCVRPFYQDLNEDLNVFPVQGAVGGVCASVAGGGRHCC